MVHTTVMPVQPTILFNLCITGNKPFYSVLKVGSNKQRLALVFLQALAP
jgi:hypothetical protein